jgi:hypothetical protein
MIRKYMHSFLAVVAIVATPLFAVASPAVPIAVSHPASATAAAQRPAAPKLAPAAPRAPVAAAARGLTIPVAPKVALAKLDAVEATVASEAAKGKSPWVIMDIDDTLMHTVTYPRNTPIPGAVSYANSLVKAGAKIVYITGRKDIPSQRTKTVASLQELGFPLGTNGELRLNNTKLNTVTYKHEATNDLVKERGVPVAAFDNEIANARMFRDDLPKSALVFRLATQSFSKDTGGKGNILVIKDFAPQVKGEN